MRRSVNRCAPSAGGARCMLGTADATQSMLCSMRLLRVSNLSDYRINVVIESRAMVGWRLSKKPLASQILLFIVQVGK